MKADELNPNVGDLRLGPDGDEVVLTQLDEEVAQRLFIGLQFFKSEYFMDSEEGVPYFQRILVKNPGDRVIRAIFSTVIQGTEGVDRLLSFSYNINKFRQMTLSFTCLLKDGTVFVSTQYNQFFIAV
jgi:hypothetical protein